MVRDPAAPTAAEIGQVFRTTGVGQGLHRLGLDGDTDYCAALNVSSCVPQLGAGPHPLALAEES